MTEYNFKNYWNFQAKKIINIIRKTTYVQEICRNRSYFNSMDEFIFQEHCICRRFFLKSFSTTKNKDSSAAVYRMDRMYHEIKWRKDPQTASYPSVEYEGTKYQISCVQRKSIKSDGGEKEHNYRVKKYAGRLTSPASDDAAGAPVRCHRSLASLRGGKNIWDRILKKT